MKISLLGSTTKCKLKKFCNWLLKELISGLSVAAAVAIATLWTTNYTQIKHEQENLESLYLGLNRPYVESLLGIPVVEFTEIESNTIRAFYKQQHSVVSCSYANEQLVAFFVIVNANKRLYQIPYNFFISHPAYLTNFTYADFSETVDDFESNCPANNDDYAYYSETYYGAAAAQYNYYVIGSYKNYFDDSYTPLIANALYIDEKDSFYNSASYDATRKRAKPNVFGMIDSLYVNSIHLASFSDELRTYNQSIFGGWWK